jgi:predicted transcriptional regulator YdeE
LRIDPEASVSVSEDPSSVGSRYGWEGELVGSGEIEHLQLERPRLIEQQLRFLKPFKSRASVSFVIEPEAAGGARVTWHMRGKLPWFMFFMKPMMERFIGMDYERGLRMVKQRVETGEVPSRVEVLGVAARPQLHVLGVRARCPLTEIGPAMSQAFAQTSQAIAPGEAIPLGGKREALSIYDDMDLKTGRIDFVSGLTTDQGTPPPEGLVHYELPGGDYLQLRHTGSYENLGNAWSGAHQYARYKKIKLSKAAGYEIYRNDPADTAAKDLITDIYLPVR